MYAIRSYYETTVMDMYDVENPEREGRAQRISFVIDPDGNIIYAHEDRDPIAHVNGAKEAVINWAATH